MRSDLVNQLEQEELVVKGGKLAESLLRLYLVVLDELGYGTHSFPFILHHLTPI